MSTLKKEESQETAETELAQEKLTFLTDLARKVAQHRRDLEAAKGEKQTAEEAMLKSDYGMHFNSACAQAERREKALSVAESELKTAVLSVYAETKEKRPIDRVEVKIFKRLEYDSDKVLKWCRDNAPSLLIVNKKPFEKTAEEIKAPVKVIEEPKCTLATDMSIYLKEGDKE